MLNTIRESIRDEKDFWIILAVLLTLVVGGIASLFAMNEGAAAVIAVAFVVGAAISLGGVWAMTRNA